MVLNQVEDLYAMIKVHVMPDFLSRDNIRLAVLDMNFNSSPGYPLCKTFQTIGNMFLWDGISISEERFNIFYHEFLLWLSSPVRYPYRVFIKNEPISAEKKKLGRWRLIFISPFYQLLLDHILYKDFNDLEAEHMWNLPTKLKWHPFWGAAEICVSTFDNPASMDKSMWDWTMQEVFVNMDKQFRKEMTVAPPLWHDLVDLSYDLAFSNCQFIFSSGLLLQQDFVGFMKSGLYVTLSTNSHCQLFIHQLAQNRCGHFYKFWTIGDDVIMTNPCDYYLSQLPNFCILKGVDNNYVFAGFDNKTKVPKYWSKHYYKLLYMSEEDLPVALDAYQRLYVFSPEKFSLIQDLLYQISPLALRSVRYLKTWSFERLSHDKYQLYA